jgi:thymidylate kinase
MADAVRGRVTVFDRYCLDSLARLTFQYGDTPEARLQARLLRGLSPRPVAAFFLDIDADVSTARKDDGWSRDQIEAQVLLYRAAAARLPVSRINGARPTDEVAAEIAATVWSRLRER